jgi:hypothetical protein
MKLFAAAVPAIAVAAFFVGVRAETPWLGPRTNDVWSVAGPVVTLSQGQTLVVATVPAGKQLVLTGATLVDQAIWAQMVEIEEVDATGATVTKVPVGMAWAWKSNGVNCEARSIGRGDGLGAVFGPGTNVVLKNIDPNSQDPPATFSYFVGGYYAAK